MQDCESTGQSPGADQSPPQPEPLPFENDQPSALSVASHAARNPTQPIIQPANRKKKAVDKKSREVARQILQEKQAEFVLDLEAFEGMKRKVVDELAQKHHKKPEYMEAILTNKSLYKKQRAPNIQNAKVFRKAKELNEG